MVVFRRQVTSQAYFLQCTPLMVDMYNILTVRLEGLGLHSRRALARMPPHLVWRESWTWCTFRMPHWQEEWPLGQQLTKRWHLEVRLSGLGLRVQGLGFKVAPGDET